MIFFLHLVSRPLCKITEKKIINIFCGKIDNEQHVFEKFSVLAHSLELEIEKYPF